MLPANQLNELLSSIDELLAPIPGDDPAGASRISDVDDLLKKYRTGEEPDENDPESQSRPPEWHKSIDLARQVLTERSKHLLVAARLTEAYTKYHGWAGLLAGFKLLRGLVEQCWDRLHPKPDSDDGPEVLAGPFEWLGISGKGANFPNTLSFLAIFGGTQNVEGGVAVDDFRPPVRMQTKRYTKGDIEKVLSATTIDAIQARLGIVEQCLSEYRALNTALDQVMAENAPSLSDLGKTLEDAAVNLRAKLPRGSAAAAAGGAKNNSESLSGSSSGSESTSAGGNRTTGSLEAAINSRAEAYDLLRQAAGLLEKIEPHSPIPYLVRRAVSLGAMPFPQLMRELIRSEEILTGMNRELGIKESSPSGEAAPSDG